MIELAFVVISSGRSKGRLSLSFILFLFRLGE